MFSRKPLSLWYLIWLLPLIVMLPHLVAASPTTDERGASELNTEAIISVSNLDLACTPPSPVTQTIRLTGKFVVQAHIVLPPSPILPPSPVIPVGTIVTLHLDATDISGIGLTDGTVFQGSQGPSQNFKQGPSPFIYDTTFDLIPSQSNETPPSPICPVQVAFQAQAYATEIGVPAISVSLITPD
jgi:hypothetical protein